MRIAIVHPYPWPEVRRGAERYLDDLAHYLAPRGHRVEIVTGTRGASRTEELDDGVIVHRLKHLRAGPAYRLGIGEVETFGARATARLLRSRPQVVHAFTPSGALAGRAARLPTLYTVLGHPDRAQLPVSRTLRNLFTAARRRPANSRSTTALCGGSSMKSLGLTVIGMVVGTVTLASCSGPGTAITVTYAGSYSVAAPSHFVLGVGYLHKKLRGRI